MPPAQLGPDSDFGTTPTLFPATIGGTVHHLVGAANKNGIYYAFDEANISGGPVWQVGIAQGGEVPQAGWGSISSSAWDGTNLYVAGGKTTIRGQNCPGGVRALDPATGAFRWERCLNDGPVLGSVTVVPGVVAVGEGISFVVMAASDGHNLFQNWDKASNSAYYGGLSIANGGLYIGNMDGNFSAFGGLPTATPTPTPTNTMVSSPTPTLSPTVTPSPTPGTTIAQDTFQRPNQKFWGTASDGQTWGGDANSVSLFSIVGNSGRVSSSNSSNTSYSAVLGPVATNAQVLLSGSLSRFNTNNLGAVLRWTDSNNWYKAYINALNQLVVQKRVNGVYTILKRVPFAATAGTSYTLRFSAVGSTLSAKVWQTGTSEPTNWMITVTDSSLQSGYCGVHLLVQYGAVATITSFVAATA